MSSDWKNDAFNAMKEIRSTQKMMEVKYNRAMPPQATMVTHRVDFFPDRHQPATMVAHSDPIHKAPVAVEVLRVCEKTYG